MPDEPTEGHGEETPAEESEAADYDEPPEAAPPEPEGQPEPTDEQGEAPPEPQGLSPQDLEAVLRAAGVDTESAAVAGTDEGLADMSAVAAAPPGAGSIDMLKDVALDVRIELGRTDMLLEDVLRLGAGSVLTLDKLAGDAVDVLVNGQLVARGEVMVLDDNFCVRITEIVSPQEESADQ